MTERPWTIRRVLEWTTEEFRRRSIPSARLDAEVLLASALDVDRLALYLDLDRPLSEAERSAYRLLVERRRRREPVAHIVGQREFWSLPISVDGRVLVPRPETEVTVEEGLELAAVVGARRMVDVGTGSGCIAVAMARECPGVTVAAIDIEPGAASIARQNVARHGLSDRIAVVVGDLLEPAGGPIDLVVSNPPYVRTAEIEGLDAEIVDHEPRIALDGGPDGLQVVRRLVVGAARALRPGGGLVLEVGHDQARQVVGLLERSFDIVRVRRDYARVERVVVARRSS